MHRAAAAVLAVAAAPLPTAHYSLHATVRAATSSVRLSGNGVVDARRRIASLSYSTAGAERKHGLAVITANGSVVVYATGMRSPAPPASKPWGRFPGALAVPLFDPGVALRLRAAGAGRHRLPVPAAEERLLFPAVPHAHVVADVWVDGAGRIVRLRASARSQTLSILLDERLRSFGTPVIVAPPPQDEISTGVVAVQSNLDPQALSQLRSMLVIVDEYYSVHGTYVGVPIGNFAAEKLVRATKTSYCVQASANGHTVHEDGPNGVVAAGGC